tara:strand:- start:700 stop:894 length:195 start_codon:yes stop_codon:yes gene_type:complete
MKVDGNLFIFLIGIFSGGLLGIMAMALIGANRYSRMNETIVNLKEQIRTNQYSKPKPRKYRKKA